jgi:hypothetical protein
MIRCRFVFIFVYNISLEPEYTLLQAAVAFDLRLRKFTVHATHMRLPSMATKLAAKGSDRDCITVQFFSSSVILRRVWPVTTARQTKCPLRLRMFTWMRRLKLLLNYWLVWLVFLLSLRCQMERKRSMWPCPGMLLTEIETHLCL